MPAPVTSTATQFFKASLEQRALSHGYVLYGKSIQTQYNLCLYLAQVLNCESPKSTEAFEACGVCRPCKWIANNAHPSVMTLSPFTYPDTTQDAKVRKSTVITVGQVRTLIAQISQHKREGEERVVIFTNAEPRLANSTPGNEANYPAPSEWQNDKESLHWLPLTSRTFSAQSANAFLKYLEEPTPGIRYFFLTQQPETLLATVVSRCQTVYVPPDLRVEATGTQALPFEMALLGWLRDCLVAERNRLPAHPATVAFIQLSEDEQTKPKRLFEALPQVLAQHRESLFGEDYLRYLAWQEETTKAINAMNHYVQPANAVWHMLHTLCEA